MLSTCSSGCYMFFFFFSSRRRHTRFDCDWSSDVCSSDLNAASGCGHPELDPCYWTELATEEKTLLALLPTSRMVPTTMTRITASMTAYSAMSCPRSSFHKLHKILFMI